MYIRLMHYPPVTPQQVTIVGWYSELFVNKQINVEIKYLDWVQINLWHVQDMSQSVYFVI